MGYLTFRKKLKLMLIVGRPMAFFGLGLIALGIIKGFSIAASTGMLLILAGFISAWTGKIGLFWIND